MGSFAGDIHPEEHSQLAVLKRRRHPGGDVSKPSTSATLSEQVHSSYQQERIQPPVHPHRGSARTPQVTLTLI